MESSTAINLLFLLFAGVASVAQTAIFFMLIDMRRRVERLESIFLQKQRMGCLFKDSDEELEKS